MLILVGTMQPLVAQPVWYVLHTALQSFIATFISVIVNGSPGHPHSKERWRDSINFLLALHVMSFFIEPLPPSPIFPPMKEEPEKVQLCFLEGGCWFSEQQPPLGPSLPPS